ncbi:ABC transporter ATP-binding protein [Chitinimonas koreensis]|uniref:ABC transporter ATP-binding protein n=1 Tax=Chitinimonas koreensis TaxID=356302 RepID=UPI00041C9E53|nr:ABC transporter ATP-binding protein [Chitinimonas koreensis]QNM97383.1 ABC transporter ATP-binding protein [Chitinimonas koreensis]
MTHHVIRLQGIGKTYRGKLGRRTEALSDIDLSIVEGEAFGFIGQNGAGKSTTIKIITGGVTATRGEAWVFDRPVHDHRARQGLAYVPENPLLYGYLTPYEVVSMGARLCGVTSADAKAHTMRWLERFDLGAVAHKPIRSFSKGMTQRTALAHALACRPRLLILDEPLSGLDPIGRKEVVEILQEYHEGGGTLFFSSHVLFDVERLADRFGLIHHGRMRAVKSLQELSGQDPRYRVLVESGRAPDGFEPERPGRWRGEIAASAMWRVLDEVRALGGRVVEVRSVLSLEQAFVDFIRREEEGAVQPA